MTKLKSCPFCGSTDAYVEKDDCYWVVCDECAISTTQFDTEADAVKAWNDRTLAALAEAKSCLAYWQDQRLIAEHCDDRRYFNEAYEADKQIAHYTKVIADLTNQPEGE